MVSPAPCSYLIIVNCSLWFSKAEEALSLQHSAFSPFHCFWLLASSCWPEKNHCEANTRSSGTRGHILGQANKTQILAELILAHVLNIQPVSLLLASSR
jgi:hypothetical protein